MNSRLVIAVTTFALTISCFAQTTSAQGLTLPPIVSGYTVAIEQDWVLPHQGYYPVRITIETNPVLATVNDEHFTISITNPRYDASNYIVRAPIVIPTGSTSGTAEIYVSSAHANNSYESRLLVERGEYDGQFDRNDILHALIGRGNSRSNQPTILIISSNFSKPSKKSWVSKNQVNVIGSTTASFITSQPQPSLDELQAIYGEMINVPASSVINQNPKIGGVHPNYLPGQWIGLSGVEEILISLQDFQSLCATQESNRSNIEKWVTAGGILIVFETKPEQADNLLPMLLGPERSVLADRISPQWKTPNSVLKKLDRLIPSQLHANMNNYSYYYNSDGNVWINAAEASSLKIAKLPVSPTFPANSRFAVSDYLNGKIVAVTGDMSKWKSKDWRLLQNTITYDGGGIRQRIGNSTGNESYNALKIPGVGDPPVRMFQVLISVFIFLAGPVMLLVLKKTEQMQLLFIAVPCLSIVVCGSLLFHAIWVDGGKQWGRAQTVTTIDHRTNMAVTHARATYYHGGRPLPYRFGSDTIALTGLRESSESLICQFDHGNGYELTGAEMRPRTPHEMVTVRSQSARQRLKLIPSSNGEPPSIENLLEAHVLLVVFKTEAGFFWVENIPVNDTVVSQPATSQAIQARLSGLIQKYSPKFLEPGHTSWTRNQYGNWGDDIRVVDSIRDASSTTFLDKPNTYIAILENFPLAAEQIENVEYKMQIHVVQGQW